MDTEQPVIAHNKAPRSSVKLIIVIGLLLILPLGLLGIIRFKKDVSSPTTASSTAAQLQAGKVSITKVGFVPATIKVKVGDTVTWTNQDASQHQVATDPYPLEDALPGFRSTVPTAAGSSYSYTFKKAGTYTYHDHIKPLQYKATVIVQ